MKTSSKLLEFHKFLDFLAGYTTASPVKRKIKYIKPSTKLESIGKNHELLKVLLQLHALNIELPGAEIDDIYTILKKLDINGYICSPRELMQIKKFLDSVKDVSTGLLKIEHGSISISTKTFSQLRERFNFLKDLNDAITFSLDHPDLIKNSASRELQAIRQDILNTETTIRSRLDGIIRGLEKEDILQDNFFTIRRGRFVVPVKIELKKRVAGIIHDYSDTEKTAFIEPSPIIEAGNTLASLKAAEKAECRKILRSLTEKAAARLEELRANNTAVIDYEFLRAIAKWGNEYQCTVPVFSEKLNLVNARHPLMESQFRREGRKKQIPLNFAVNPQTQNTVAITGSNAGGKTVVLKTIGLLSLIAQSGLPVPCDAESSFVCFHNILADIGDEQSITHNLSTFSAHLTKVKSFFSLLKKSHKKNNMVLIDEIGSGTDPLEGGSLACAILQKMSEQATITVATTHLGTVKTYVSATEKMVNAAMLFNTKTFQPEFRIHVGRPGASHALNLARQLNLPSEVLNHAETILDSDQLRLESMLANLEEDQRQFYQDVEQLRIDKERTSQAKKEAETQLSQLRKERKKIMHEAYQEASKMTQRTHKEMQKVLKKLNTDNVAEVRKELHEKQHKIDKGLKTTEAKPEAPISINTLKEGMTVWVEKLQARAKVTFINLNNKKVKLDLDGLPVEVPVKQIGKIINDKAQPLNPRKGPLKTSRPRAAKSSQEINLIGLRVHQALNKLERFIDQSLLSNTSEVRIVHGFGTGRLRESIHEYLNRLNLSYRDGEKEEGGGGATVVTL